MDIRDAQRRDDDIIPETGSFGDDLLAGMLKRQSVQDRPVEPVAPALLPQALPGTYRFRTKVDRRNHSIKLRVYRELGDEKMNADGKKRFERWAARLFGDGDIRKGLKALSADREVFNALGEYYIRFDPLPNKMEAVFETTDPLVAAYVRSRVHEYPFIYEEVSPIEVRLADGSIARVIPADDASRVNMANAAAMGSLE